MERLCFVGTHAVLGEVSVAFDFVNVALEQMIAASGNVTGS